MRNKELLKDLKLLHRRTVDERESRLIGMAINELEILEIELTKHKAELELLRKNH